MRAARNSVNLLRAIPLVFPEDPPGTFHGLENGGTYWVYVSRDGEEERLDREKMRKVRLPPTSHMAAGFPRNRCSSYENRSGVIVVP